MKKKTKKKVSESDEFQIELDTWKITEPAESLESFVFFSLLNWLAIPSNPTYVVHKIQNKLWVFLEKVTAQTFYTLVKLTFTPSLTDSLPHSKKAFN